MVRFSFLPLVPALLGVVVAQLDPDQCSFHWPTGPGTPEQFQEPNPLLQSLLAQIDTNRIESIINTLVGFGTRNTLSDKISNSTFGVMAARDWIAEQMQGFAAKSNGRMNIEVQTFVQQPTSALPVATNISNVVATLTGTTDPDRVYVVTGHYDSRVTDVTNFMSFSPGADDDASGVAVIMELARIMADQEVPATMVFAAVSGEEQGLFGSTFLANSMKTQDVQGSQRFKVAC